MRGTRPSNQWKGEVMAATVPPEIPDPGMLNPTAPNPCENMPNQSATKAELIEWLASAGVTISDPSSLDKSELWSLVTDVCD